MYFEIHINLLYMKTNFFFLILGICCGLICYKLYDRYFIDTGVESCREETLSELQYDEEKSTKIANQPNRIFKIFMTFLNSTDPKSNRSFTISKEFVAYMYFHYSIQILVDLNLLQSHLMPQVFQMHIIACL